MNFARSFATICLLALASCSDPRSEPMPTDLSILADNSSFKAAAAKLPEQEQKSLTLYVLRAGTIAPADRAKTIGDAIASQRRYEEDRDAKQHVAKAEAAKYEDQQAAGRASGKLIKVSIPKFTFFRHDPPKKQMGNRSSVTVHVENGSTRTTRTLTGYIVLKSASGQTLSSVTPYAGTHARGQTLLALDDQRRQRRRVPGRRKPFGARLESNPTERLDESHEVLHRGSRDPHVEAEDRWWSSLVSFCTLSRPGLGHSPRYLKHAAPAGQGCVTSFDVAESKDAATRPRG